MDEEIKSLSETETIKNIIYSNEFSNKFGQYRCFCAPISQFGQIQAILKFLRKHANFHSYERYSYAYRIIPENTENNIRNNEETKGGIDDQTLSGCSERLLHLLMKFNIENVLLAVGVKQIDVLQNFNFQTFQLIVDKGKDLLNNLYVKILEYEQNQAAIKQSTCPNQQVSRKLKILDLQIQKKNQKFSRSVKKSLDPKQDFSNINKSTTLSTKKQVQPYKKYRPQYVFSEVNPPEVPKHNETNDREITV